MHEAHMYCIVKNNKNVINSSFNFNSESLNKRTATEIFLVLYIYVKTKLILSALQKVKMQIYIGKKDLQGKHVLSRT